MRQGFHLDPKPGVVLSIAAHVALFFIVSKIDPPEDEELDLIEFEVAEAPPEEEPKEEEPVEEEEEQEQEQEQQDQPEPEKPPPKRERRPPPDKPEPPANEPPEPAEPMRIELPEDQTIKSGNSGVNVTPGTRTQPGRTQGARDGSPQGKPGAKGSENGRPDGKGKTGNPWAPKSDLYIAQQPRVVKVPEIRCPAVRELGVSGTVVLEVQVRRDGSVRRARVSSGMGHGCDAIAVKALRQAKFKPALATDGNPADYELRYEYVFEYEG